MTKKEIRVLEFGIAEAFSSTGQLRSRDIKIKTKIALVIEKLRRK